MSGEFFNDFLYCTFKIGLPEESAKIFAFLIFTKVVKKQINEPIDYLAYICTTALGFSAIENVMYFYKHGPGIITGRAILSTVGHMFDTSLIAYGIIRHKYYYKGKGTPIIILFFFLAALSHGFYDFWILYEGTKAWGGLITILYFLVTISIFAVILNNALNHSSFFSYKRVIDSYKVANRLLTYYGVVFFIQFIFLAYSISIPHAIGHFISSLYVTGFIVLVSCIRLSRFKLIKDRWHKIKIELPFGYTVGDPYGMNKSQRSFRIKGDSYNESFINTYYEEYFALHPLTNKTTYLQKMRLGFIEKKVFLKNDDTYYVTKIFITDENGTHKKILLKPKTSDVTMVNQKHPIVAVLEVNAEVDIENINADTAKFRFREWAVAKPYEGLEIKLLVAEKAADNTLTTIPPINTENESVLSNILNAVKETLDPDGDNNQETPDTETKKKGDPTDPKNNEAGENKTEN